MRKISKHGGQKIIFAGLSGGINVAQSGEQIADNEMQLCENFMYLRDSQRLAGRGGLSAPLSWFSAPVVDLFYDVDTNVIVVFLEDRDVYIMVGVQYAAVRIGSLSGDLPPSCCKFKNKLWIASGDKLQYYDFVKDSEIHTVLSSPLCDIVFERFGRLAVARTGNDRITYSGTGDGTYWEENTNDASSSQWVDVGEGDSGDILAVVPLATDLMILKSNGKVYQFCGDKDKDSWAIYNIGNNADPVGRNAAVNIGDSVVFLSRRGFKTLAATMDYGNIASADIGDKFNALVTGSQYNPRMFHLKRYRMILVRPTADWSFFVCFNYALNAATVLRFGMPISSVMETADELVVASGKAMYLWSEEYTMDDKREIAYKIKTKDILGGGRLLLKGIDTKFSGDHAGTAVVATGNLRALMPTNSRRRVRCNHSTDCISLEVNSNSRFILDQIVLEVADL